MAGLKLEEFSDRELMQIMAEIGDEEGWCTVPEFAAKVKISHPNPNNCVGVRFAWMRRYGVLERDGDHWRLTDTGEAILSARLSGGASQALRRVGQSTGMLAVEMLTAVYQEAKGRPAGHLMRRAWRRGTL